MCNPVGRFFLLGLCLLLAGCGEPPRVVVEVDCDDPAVFASRLLLRLPQLQPVITSVEPQTLLTELSVPADRLAVLGFETASGLWRFPPESLRGGRPPFVLSEPAFDRLERFRLHALKSEEVREANDADRPLVLAAHLTRALGTEIVAKQRATVVFVRLDSRAPGLEPFAADAVREMVELAGPQAASFIWLRDGQGLRLYSTSGNASWSRAELVRVLNGD